MVDSKLSDLVETKPPNCTSKILILLSVPLLLFVALFVSYMGVFDFRVELHSVIMIGAIFIIYLFFLRHNGFYASCKFKQELNNYKAALKEYISKHVLVIGSVKKANAPYSQFAKDYTASLRNENFASVAAGIFPTLGILGTFISIAISMPDFSSQTSAVLEKEISLLLGGVGTAFYVSIYGIFLSIWWILFDKSGLSSFERQINQIKEQTRSLFWSKEEIEQTYFQKSMENFEQLNSVFKTFDGRAMVDSLNKSLQDRIELFEHIIHHEQEMIQKSMRQVEASLDIATSAQKTHEIVQKQSQAMQDVLLDIQSSATHMSSIAESMRSSDAQTKKISQALEHLSEQNLQNITEGIEKNFEVMRKNTDQIGWSFSTHLAEFDEKFGEKLKETLLTIDSEVVKILETLESIKRLERE